MVAVVADLPYPITIAQGALASIGDVVADVTPDHRVVVITDKNVAGHYAQPVAASINHRRGREDTVLISIPPGERLKVRETWSHLTDSLLEHRLGRDTTIVALGGGVIGDLAGFVAATYMRGIPVVQVPTTLLAMVDASVGGKTGVDTKFGKNLVGAFHQPAAVVIDPAVLKTLPTEILREGMAEVIKHGVVADADYFNRVSAFANRLNGPSWVWSDFEPIIRRSVEIKADIVGRDEREAGLRKVLNFGHTIAHALEALDGYANAHGRAVGIGLVIEARIAERVGVAERGTAQAVEDVVTRMSLPLLETDSLGSETVTHIIELTYGDKKARGGRVQYALPQRIGAMAGADSGWTVPVEDAIVRRVLTA